MTFPDDRTMLTLLSLSCSSRGRYSPDGRQFAAVEVSEHERVEWEIQPAELDELERQGWLELLPPADGEPADQAKVSVSARGEYAAKRWVQQNRRRMAGLLAAFAPGRRPDLGMEVVSYSEGA